MLLYEKRGPSLRICKNVQGPIPHWRAIIVQNMKTLYDHKYEEMRYEQ